jgi:hypothetical protein
MFADSWRRAQGSAGKALLVGGERAALPALGNWVVPRLILFGRKFAASTKTALRLLELLLLLLALLSG